MVDGIVWVYLGLMDVMLDDQVLVVIGYEIGYVYNKYSYEQMQKWILIDFVFQVVVLVGGIVGDLIEGQLGQIVYIVVNVQFFQCDELEFDIFVVCMLYDLGKDFYVMKCVIEMLQVKFGFGGSFFSLYFFNVVCVECI